MTFVPALPALPTFMVAAAVLMLGVVVVARERASNVSFAFFALTLSVSTWLIGISMMLLSANAHTAMFFARMAYVGVAIIPASVLHFTLSLLEETRKRRLALIICWTAT